jgi:hypothetical protein
MKNILAVHSERQMQRAADEFAHYGEWGGARERWPSRNNGRPLWNELKKPVLDTEKILFVGWKAGRKLQLKERWVDGAVTVKKAALGLTQKKVSTLAAHTFSRAIGWAWDFVSPGLVFIQPGLKCTHALSLQKLRLSLFIFLLWLPHGIVIF